MRAALLHGYGLHAVQVMRVQAGTDTLNYRVVLDDERQIFVKAMRLGTDERDVRTTAHLACFARSGGLPVPCMWLGRDGVPLVRHDGRVLTVQEYIDGTPASDRALTVAQAEELGGVIGRLHRRLACYPGTLPALSARWWTAEGMSRFDGDYQRLQLTLDQHGGERTAAHREMLEQRREDLLTHAAALRGGFPAAPVRQPLHADLTTPNVLMNSADHVAAVIDFYARTGPAAWEVGRIALDPRTVAGEMNWMPVTLALIAAYHQENPYLPCADLVMSVRMALVHALHSLFGLYEHYVTPEAYEVGGVLRYWEQRHIMTRRVLDRLDSLEEQIRTAVGAR
ncbi:phosphotransferase enzyme family protein [Streptomyces sp. A30]|uniref:phosphotransferase enzyme family protein n=1 Tax=Streptomyces sp. A30 TaxID=2789273 RepID=UPI00397F1FA5